ncbi:MAG TPA: MFS transporter [Ktedonobacterales bacterium]|nr:MFS transporter [Ktedonobacterales bacterium]
MDGPLSTARQRWIALILLSAIEFMILLDTSIVNIALPAIKTGLHFSEADLQWVQNAYILVFGGFLLLGGRAADLFGRRRFYLIGLGLFTASSLLAGLAPTGGILLAARAAQGIGAAIVIPAEQSLLVTIFTDKEEFNRAFGIWGAMGAAGGIFGLLLGGVLTQLVGWPWIFLINVPIGALALLLSPRLLPESRATGQDRRLDILGAVVVTVAVGLLAYAPIAGQEYGWGSPLAFGSLALAALLLLAFPVIEARSKSPLVPLRIFRIRNANGANIVSFLVGAAHAPMFFLLSLYLQQVLGYNALTAGLAILPVGATSLIFSLLVLPRALDHLGPRGVLVAGMLLLAIGLLLFARVPVPGNYLLDILPASIIVAMGLPCAFAGSNIAAVTAVEKEETGLASGLMNTMQRVGSGIGIAALTAVFVARIGPMTPHTSLTTLATGFQAGFLGAALLAVLGAVLALMILRQPKPSLSTIEGDKELAPANARKFHFHH